MRILVVTDLWPTALRPGLGDWVMQSVEGTRSRGHDVRVVLLRRVYPPREVLAAIPSVRLAFRLANQWVRHLLATPLSADIVTKVWYTSPPGGKWQYLWGSWCVRLAGRKIAAIAREFGPDVVHGHFAIPSGAVANWTAGGVGAASVVSVHGADVRHVPTVGALSRQVFCATLTQADAVVANSSTTAKDLERICSGVAARVLWQGGTIGLRPHPVGSVIQVVTVGHIVPQKGVFEAATALALCRENGIQLNWTIVGGGSDAMILALHRHIHGLGMSDCTCYMGERSNQEVIAVMQRSDVFLLPTKEDAYGVVFAEAAGSGLVVVGGEAAGAMRDFRASGAPVISVNPDDVSCIATALMGALNDAAALEALKIQTQDWARANLGWDRYCAQLEEVYKHAQESR